MRIFVNILVFGLLYVSAASASAWSVDLTGENIFGGTASFIVGDFDSEFTLQIGDDTDLGDDRGQFFISFEVIPLIDVSFIPTREVNVYPSVFLSEEDHFIPAEVAGNLPTILLRVVGSDGNTVSTGRFPSMDVWVSGTAAGDTGPQLLKEHEASTVGINLEYLPSAPDLYSVELLWMFFYNDRGEPIRMKFPEYSFDTDAGFIWGQSVPVPGAVWLLGSALLLLVRSAKRS